MREDGVSAGELNIEYAVGCEDVMISDVGPLNHCAPWTFVCLVEDCSLSNKHIVLTATTFLSETQSTLASLQRSKDTGNRYDCTRMSCRLTDNSST